MSAPTYADVLRADAAAHRVRSAYYAANGSPASAIFYAKQAEDAERRAAEDEAGERKCALDKAVTP